MANQFFHVGSRLGVIPSFLKFNEEDPLLEIMNAFRKASDHELTTIDKTSVAGRLKVKAKVN